MTNSAAPDVRAARVRLVEDHLRAENANDLEAIMETFSETASFVLNGLTLSDGASIRALYSGFGFGGGGSFSDVRAELAQMHVGEETVVTELVLSGRHTDAWQGIAATNREFRIPACAIFTFDGGGKLAGERVYFDGALLLRQLGVLG